MLTEVLAARPAMGPGQPLSLAHSLQPGPVVLGEV